MLQHGSLWQGMRKALLLSGLGFVPADAQVGTSSL